MSSDDDWFERGIATEDDEREGADERGSATERAVDDDTDDATESPFGQSAHDEPTNCESPFAEDFSEAFDNAPVPQDGHAMDGIDDGSLQITNEDAPFGGEDILDIAGSDFDAESFDSALERIEMGIEGLDEMILGGVPAQSLIVTIGSAGTGKTTIGLQFLNVALEAGDRAVYITLEETQRRIQNTALEKGWDFDQYEENGQLAIVDLNPVEMANSLGSLRNDLSRLIEEFGATRVVLDSVSLLEMMYDHPARRRSEVFEFTHALKEAGVTMLVTSEASDTDPYASRHGIIEYLSDAVFILRYVRSDNFQETRLAIEIQKIRDANHSRQPKPYEITNQGINVHQRANLF